MAVCKAPECIGWTLAEGDVFCAWCGTRLLELSLALQQKRDNRWETLSPPTLDYDQRPELQLVLRNSGQTGPIPVTPAQVQSSVPWLVLDTSPFKRVDLQAGDVLAVGVSRFKVPDGESRHEAVLSVTLGPGHSEPLASLTLEIVPRPQLDLDVPVERVELEAGGNLLEVGLRLLRGRAILNEVPGFEGGWATVAWGDGVTPPVTLDQNGTTRVPLRLRLRNETSDTFAATSGDVILRRGSVTVKCAGREEVPIKVPLELEITLAPELYIEPFRDRKRLEWALVKGITENRPFVLTLYNGFPNSRGHSLLEITRVEATSGEGPATWLKGTELNAPLRLKSGQSARFPLRIDTAALSGGSATAQLTFHTNAPRTPPYYLKVDVREPSEFQGWLVVDLGTTNSCAALLDEDRAFDMVGLDDASQEKATTMPSVVGYQRLVSAVEYEVGGKVWSISHLPDVAASVVIAAKRRIGTDKPFVVVPQKEPAETCQVPAREVLTHLYASVIARATETLASRGETAALISRIIVAHPSRFTMHQIDELKQAVHAALAPPLKRHLGPGAAVRDLRTIHEPLGAALHFLNDWRQQAALHQRRKQDDITYTLLVYDFGGGTIDITLLRVHSIRELRPGMAPRVSNGNGHGSLATAADSDNLVLPILMRTTLARCRSALAGQGGAAQVLPAFGVDGADDSDTARNNAFLLEQFARSVLRVMPRQALVAGDETAWNALRANAHVNDRLALTALRAGQKVRQEFMRQDVLPSVWEVRERLAQGPVVETIQETAEQHPYAYTVTPHVVGATGHRWLGGEDVTAMVRELLVERLVRAVKAAEKTDDVVLPVDADTCPIQQAQAARNNASLLRKWAEETKILLSRGAGRDELSARIPTLEFWVRGQLRPYSGTQLSAMPVLPTLDDLSRRLEPTLAITLDMAQRLVAHEGLSEPDVVLRVGKSSLLPLVPKVLGRVFPHALQVAPPDAKECVVQGACLQPLPGAGVTISQRVTRAGVRLGMSASERLSATTSRIGIKIVDCGKTFFHEILPAGEPIPEKGLQKRMSGFGLMPGVNRVPVLENAGARDEMLLSNGQRNPNIEVLGEFEVEVPSDMDAEAVAEVDLELSVDADINLQLSVYAGERRLGPYALLPKGG